MSAFTQSTYYILTDGTIKACGLNNYGQLGIGNTTNQLTPVDIGLTDNDVKRIYSSYGRTLFLMRDGTVKACGYNNCGQLGTGDTTNQLTPVDIGLTNVKEIACGYYYTMFLLKDGTVKGCGRNNYGQLGIDDTTDQIIPVDIGLTDVKQVACCYESTIFVMKDGTVRACGHNNYGQLGIDNTTDQTTPVDLGINNIERAYCGSHHAFCVSNTNVSYGFGYNIHGQLGDGSTTNKLKPYSNQSNVKQIACGYDHTLFLLNDGTVYVCGHNGYGQLGNGNTTNQSSKTKLTLTDIKEVDCGAYHSVFLSNNNSTKICGINSSGQIGNGNTINQTTLTSGLNNVKHLSENFDDDIVNYYLVLDNQKIKTYFNDDWETIGTAPVTREMFKKGFENLNTLNNSTIKKLESNDFKLLNWTNEDEVIEKDVIIFTDNIFRTVSSNLPSIDKFISNGMDNLDGSIAELNRRKETLEPQPMTDKSEILQAGEEGRVFSGKINLKKYIDIRSIKVEVK